jgi:tetratricopeptide (TPR) repeat protein
MKKKLGQGGHKPDLPPRQPGGSAPGGLTRKDGYVPQRASTGPKDIGGKAFMGEIPDDELQEALDEIDAKLAENPHDRELHVNKYKVLRKLGERGKMRAALQLAARELKDPFFGIKLAEALEEEGRYQAALEWRRWVIQFDADDPDYVRRLAGTAVRAGDFQTAEQSYSKLVDLRQDEDNPLGGTFYEEMVGKGFDPNKRRELQKIGLRLLGKALSAQSKSGNLLESAARLSYRVRDLEAARSFYDRAISTNPHHRNIRDWKWELLRVYAASGFQREWREMNADFTAELKEHLKINRGDSRAWTILARQQIQGGQFEPAIETLKSALRADSRNDQALWELGRLYVRMGRSQEAVDYYSEIISDPNEKRSVRRAIERALADLFFKTGRYRESLEIYQRELETNLAMIAPIYEAVDELETAEEYYLRSVVQSPRDARSHLGLAEYWVRREQWEKAIKSAQDGLACTYATEEVHSNLAVALATSQMRTGQVEAALQTMEEICQTYPDSIHQTFRKVKILVMLRRKDEALALADEVRSSAQHQTGCAPAESSLWSLLGDCHSLLGNTKAAEEAYSNALQYDFMDSIAVRGLGLVAEKQGDHKRALEMFGRFVLLDPLNLATPTIRQRIEELREKVGPLAPEPTPEPSLTSGPGFDQPAMGGGASVSAMPSRELPAPPPQAEEDREGWLGGGDDDDWFEPDR